jgi:hypothetical protein
MSLDQLQKVIQDLEAKRASGAKLVNAAPNSIIDAQVIDNTQD